MVPASTCPDAQHWRRFLLGLLPEADMEGLGQHLAGCAACLQTVRSAQADDTLVEAMRAQPTSGTTVLPESVERLLRRLKGLRFANREPAVEEATADHLPLRPLSGPDTPSEPAPPRGELTQELYDFLAPAEAANELGRLGPYRVLKVLGTGGMGVVFQAEDPHLKRLVALKAMRPALATSATSRQRFLREAQATASLDHDHIVHIYQVGEDRGIPFLAMQLLKGEALEDRLLREGKLPPAEVLRVGRETAEGLAAAHAVGLIHRDVKPANIWLEAGRGRVKLLDFGLARAAEGGGALTHPGSVAGTPAYMAPEQAQGQAVDARSDLFSLGCVLYRACTGECPFKGSNSMAVLLSLAQDEPPPPRVLDPELPPALSDLVMQLLAKNPVGRPASARNLVDSIAAIERDRTALLSRPDACQATVPPAAVLPPALALKEAGRARRWWPAAVAATVLFAGLLLWGAAFVVRSRHGTLKVTTAEPDVTIYVDGEEKITIDSKQVGKVELIPGEHRMTVKRGDEELFTDSFTLRSGGEAVIEAKWEPRVAKKGSGSPGKVAPEEKAPRYPPLDEMWAKKVAALPAAAQVKAVTDELRRRNPAWEGKVTHRANGDRVHTLDIQGDYLADLTPVRALPGLTALGLDCPHLGGLSPLRGMRLQQLISTSARLLSDLTPLERMPLQELVFGFSGVSDLSPLRKLPLTNLQLYGSPVSDLSPLTGLKLSGIRGGAEGAVVRDLSPLKGMPLTWVDWPSNPFLHDLAPLGGMNVGTVNIRQAGVYDLTPLKTMSVTELSCDYLPEREPLLRSLPRLKTLNGKPVAEFWKDVAARKADRDAWMTRLDAWASGVAALPPTEQVKAVSAKLRERNPGFEGGVADTAVEDGKVVAARLDTSQVTDVSPLRALPHLKRLSLVGQYSDLYDLSPLKGAALTHLDVSGTRAADLTPLAGMKLESFSCGRTLVSDLSPLGGMPLRELSCPGCPVKDLGPLAGAPLRSLTAWWTDVRDVSPLRGLPLERLDLGNTPTRDLGPLAGLKLKGLSVSGTSVKELTPLRGMPLEELGCSGTGVTDLAPLAVTGTLRSLWCEHTPVWDLAPLKNLSLAELHVSGTGVSDLSPLAGITTLRELSCNRTKVADLTPLAGLKLTKLVFKDSLVADLSPLKGMPLTLLIVDRTGVRDLSALNGMPLAFFGCVDQGKLDYTPLRDAPLERLWCDFWPERDAATLRSFKSLREINSVPAEKIWKGLDSRKVNAVSLVLPAPM